MVPLSHQTSKHSSNEDNELSELARVWTKTASEFVLENRPASIAALVAHLRDTMQNVGFADKSTIIRICGALTESLDNALYHGNLELSSQLRHGDHSAWYAAIAERQQLSPYRDRRIFVAVEISKTAVSITIRDEGPGFDYSKLPDPTAASNIDSATGRGVYLVRNLMDEVCFNASGNEITFVKHISSRGGRAI